MLLLLRRRRRRRRRLLCLRLGRLLRLRLRRASCRLRRFHLLCHGHGHGRLDVLRRLRRPWPGRVEDGTAIGRLRSAVGLLNRGAAEASCGDG